MSTEPNTPIADESFDSDPTTVIPTVEPAAQAPAQQKMGKKRQPSPLGQAVSGEPTDAVYLAAFVFKSPTTKKSLSVHHLQRRLAELGYQDAYTDKDGWYGDLTASAVAAYQRDNGIPGDGMVDGDTLESIFADDQNVRVVLS